MLPTIVHVASPVVSLTCAFWTCMGKSKVKIKK